MSFRPSTATFFILLGYLATATVIASLLTPSRPASLPPWMNIIIVSFVIIGITRHLLYTLLGSHFTIRQIHGSKHTTVNEDFQPLVSVLVPAWNEEVGLIATIQSVFSSSYHNLEIIVINDGSTDQSDNLMRTFLDRYRGNIPIRYHYQPNGGKSVALNTGLSRARGDLVITIDADSIVQKNTIQEFVKHFADPTVVAAVGTVKIGNTQTLWGILQRLEYMVGFYFKRAEAVMNSIYIIGGAAAAFRRSVFDTIGPYRTDHITEDTELTLRLQKHGMKIVYAASAVVHTEGASTLSGLLRQRLRWKRGRFEAFLEHRSLFFSRLAQHRKLLGWLVMPLALVGDAHLLLELPFLLTMLTYGFITGNFLPLLVSTAIITSLILIQIVSSEREPGRGLLYLLAPISWWLLILATTVELYALTCALWTMTRRKAITWQVWQRVGLAEATPEPSLQMRQPKPVSTA